MKVATLLDVLRHRAHEQPDQRVYTFLVDGETRAVHQTHAQLDRRARAIAVALRALGAAGERALLLYPPGLDYIAGFFACMYGGVIAVPAYPPDPAQLERTLPRLQAIMADAQTSIVMTTASLQAMARALFARMPGSLPGLSEVHWLATDQLDDATASGWRHPGQRADDIAFLQYTSGSTDRPKGVMLTHGNLLANSARIRECFGHSTESRGVIWLPPYHDMGLIGGIIQPLYVGFPVTLMSPLHFLQKPMRWLRAVSRFAATTSGGPNFAYDLCVRKSHKDERAALDLSRWDLAFNGAEPIRPPTLEQFASAFAIAGFERTAFYPCYGLAEATLIVSGGDKAAQPLVRSFDGAELAAGRAVETGDDNNGHDDDGSQQLVACGRAVLDQTIAIIRPTGKPTGEPTDHTRCAPGEIGEIWVSGASVAAGYWRQPEETDRTFRAVIRHSDTEQLFLRTGDLGFVDADGQLFVTGRLKDLIIVRGRNFYPQDIEQTVESCHPGMRPGCGAAFADTADHAQDGEHLIVIQEFDRRKHPDADLDEVLGAVRRAVASAHDIQPHAVTLIEPRTIPKTSSGKIQRRACRVEYRADGLRVLASWSAPPTQQRDPLTDDAPDNVSTNMPTGPASLTRWLIDRIAHELHLPAEQIDTRAPLAQLGLSSVQAVALTAELETLLKRPLAPTLIYQYHNIEALAAHLGASAAATEQPSVSQPVVSSRQHGRPPTDDPIAIVGIGCRFPGADGPDQFWQLLADGGDAVTEVSPARESLCKCSFGRSRAGGFLSDGSADRPDESGVAGFEPGFFGISKREARSMDPQQRLLLEVTWEAIEDAGHTAEQLRGSPTGVFIGISTNDYSRIPPGSADSVYRSTGNASSIAANRLSYFLDLNGPSISLDTACSSSLVAVHMACQSLRSGETTLALAGGVNLLLSPEVTENLRRAGFLSPTGRCRTFSADADGYVRGEGVGVVLLKPAARARADGDRVYALIRGGAVNSDGRSNGLTAPRRQAQEAVLRAAYRHAAIAPRAVDYLETHGTGTALGDPIEVDALAAVVGADRPADRPCIVGAVKANIGHLEAAAGIAGLIKTALALHRRLLPPIVHFAAPNPHIRFAELPVRVQRSLGPWPAGREMRIAGVSSFGFGGTNAHIVLQGADEQGAMTEGATTEGATTGGEAANESTAAPVLLPISAHTDAALRVLAGRYAALVRSTESLSQLARGAANRRSHLARRLAIVAHDREQAAQALDAFARGESPPEVLVAPPDVAPRATSPVLVFTDHGQPLPATSRALLDRLVELGAPPDLAQSLVYGPPADGHRVLLVSSRPSPSDDERDDETPLLTALGTLYVHGHDLDWRRHYPGPTPHLALPATPWQREICWVDYEDIP